MSGYDGGGNYDLAFDFTDERDAGTKILASQVDQMFSDAKTGFEAALTKNGETGTATVLDVDNIRLDGNTLSSTNTNGNIEINPNGTGTVNMNTSRVTGISVATSATDAVSKQQMDGQILAAQVFN